MGVTKFLAEKRSPSRKVNELDNRGSHFYLAMYWAEALAEQTENAEIQARFKVVAQELAANETKINEELIAVQGQPMNIGGYFMADEKLAEAAMRPSVTLNTIINDLAAL